MKGSFYNKDFKSERIIIPVKVEDYEDLFNPYDNRKIENRRISSELNEYLKDIFLEIPNVKNEDFELRISLPLSKKSKLMQYDTHKGILNYYKSFNVYEGNIRKLNIRQIVYYLLIGLLFQVLCYFLKSNYGESFYSEILSTGATVLLWQVMTIVFIESKTFKFNKNIYNKLSNLHITFVYEKRED